MEIASVFITKEICSSAFELEISQNITDKQDTLKDVFQKEVL